MKLLAIDGNSIVNRAFYGIRELSNQAGFPTNAIYGFLTILRRLVDETSPDGLCVCFDRREPTFRHLAYDGYKAQRTGMPEELAVQMPKLKEVLDALNIPRYELAGWEADDLLGTIAQHCAQTGDHCIIATGDKDSLQLISETTYIYLVSSRMGRTTTREVDPLRFQEEYGFAPKGIIDLKALMGDASDNIPGVKGIGEKTGMALIQEYGSVAHIYEELDTLELKPAVRKKLEEGREMAKLSYDLATIHCDAPMGFDLAGTVRKTPNNGALYTLFQELEFYRFIEDMGLEGGGEAAAEPETVRISCTIETVETETRAQELLQHWAELEQVAVLPLPDLSVLAVQAGEAMAICRPAKFSAPDAFLAELFSGRIQVVLHDSKPILRALLERGIDAKGICFDTALAAYLLAPTDGSYDLDRLAVQYFPKDCKQAPEPAKVYLAAGALDEGAEPEALGVFASHCAWIAALYDILPERLDQLGLRQVYETVDFPLCRVLAQMEREGILVDQQALETFGAGLKTRIEQLQQQILELAGESFNINSTQQLGVILFERLGLPPVKKTKTGYSTSIEVLEKLRGTHPIIECIIEYRQLTKLNSTYVEGLRKTIDPVDGRIHTSFQNTVTATGRLSSTEPNLQNIPVRTELGAQMRHMFVAREGWVLVDADYSQIELRLLAHMADDETMIAAFRSGEDVHRSTAAQVFGVSTEQVTPQMRRHAKAVNFGIVYGISDFSLAQDIGVTRKEAAQYMARYFEKFHGVRQYMWDIVQKARNDGFVSTLLGRRRWLPELNSTNYNLRSFGERVALNMPIQGTAADIMKLAMLRVAARLEREKLEARLILQVHDELIVECPAAEADKVQALLVEEMEGVMDLSVPLETDAHVGKSWGEAKG